MKEKEQDMFRPPVEGDTVRRFVVVEEELVFRLDVDGVGDWYIVCSRTIAQNPDPLPGY